MAKYDKNNAEKWLNEHHFGYYNSEEDKGTGAEIIPSVKPVFENWDDNIDWLDDDPVEQDREHANLYGGDREYCDECGRRLTMGEWGGYCSHCNPEYDTYEDEFIDDDDSEWELVDRKSVEDSDGFVTEYSWYKRGDEHVMVFGDSDIYSPEDGDYDAEFDNEERAREWFSNYEGFTDHNEGIDKNRFDCLEDECEEEKPLNEAKTYMGIPNTEYTSHGEWADPEITIYGKSFNYYDVEDYLWGDYEEICAEKGEHPSDEGFEAYCKENGETRIDDFFTTYVEGISAKEIIEDVKEYADNNFGEIVKETDNSVDVFFDDYGDSKADIFIEDLEKSYLGERGLIKCEKSSHSIGDINDADDYENEVVVKVTATPNSLSESLDDAIKSIQEAFDDEDGDKPYTKSQIRDELKRETSNWTKASDEIYYGFESEYEYAMTVLKKHYNEVSGEKVSDSRFNISFSNPTKKLKEGYTHFKFTSGSNPYIAKTEQERDRLLKKYGDKVTKKSDTEYVVDDKVEDKFVPMDESFEGRFCIVAKTKDGKTKFYKDGAFIDDYKNATIFTDMDEAREEWFDIDKSKFKRVFIPNYDENAFASLNEGIEDDLFRKASVAYKNSDDDFFRSLSDDELVILWTSCSIADMNPYGAPYDDEVYDAIADRPNKRDLFDRATETVVNKMPMYNLTKVYARYYKQEPNGLSREQVSADVLKAIKNNNLCESKQLNEGPGAGYTIDGDVTIKQMELSAISKIEQDNNSFVTQYEVTFNCEGTGIVDDLEFESYYYGDKIESANVTFDTITISLYIENNVNDDIEFIRNFVEDHREEIQKGLIGYKFSNSYSYGGGWVHSTYDGTLSDGKELIDSSDTVYEDDWDYGVTRITATLSDNDVISYIDRVVTGDNVTSEYTVYDRDWEPIDSFFEQADAIKYAQENGYARVVREEFIERANGDQDFGDHETVWENDDIEDFDESFKNIPGGKTLIESLVKNTLDTHPGINSREIARKTFDKSYEKHNISFKKWNSLIESVNKK